jgi:crossover junction endodeoxyribonuclease RusA
VIELELPFPPSINHYWRRVGARTLISRGGRAFRQSVCSILAARRIQPLEGPLELLIELYPPDRRRRDADNSLKSLLDALQHGGAYGDDSQIVHLDTWKREPIPGGMAVVRITRHGVEPC